MLRKLRERVVRRSCCKSRAMSSEERTRHVRCFGWVLEQVATQKKRVELSLAPCGA